MKVLNLGPTNEETHELINKPGLLDEKLAEIDRRLANVEYGIPQDILAGISKNLSKPGFEGALRRFISSASDSGSKSEKKSG
jgi:hypothetical protein